LLVSAVVVGVLISMFVRRRSAHVA